MREEIDILEVALHTIVVTEMPNPDGLEDRHGVGGHLLDVDVPAQKNSFFTLAENLSPGCPCHRHLKAEKTSFRR